MFSKKDKSGSRWTKVKTNGPPGPAHEILVFITLLSNKGSEEPARAFAAHIIIKAWMYMQMKNHASTQSGYASIDPIVDFRAIMLSA